MQTLSNDQLPRKSINFVQTHLFYFNDQHILCRIDIKLLFRGLLIHLFNKYIEHRICAKYQYNAMC